MLGITSAVVVVDIPLATGKPLDAVADYVALVALAPARLPPEQPAVPSIIGLFGRNSGAVEVEAQAVFIDGGTLLRGICGDDFV